LSSPSHRNSHKCLMMALFADPLCSHSWTTGSGLIRRQGESQLAAVHFQIYEGGGSDDTRMDSMSTSVNGGATIDDGKTPLEQNPHRCGDQTLEASNPGVPIHESANTPTCLREAAASLVKATNETQSSNAKAPKPTFAVPYLPQNISDPSSKSLALASMLKIPTREQDVEEPEDTQPLSQCISETENVQGVGGKDLGIGGTDNVGLLISNRVEQTPNRPGMYAAIGPLPLASEDDEDIIDASQQVPAALYDESRRFQPVTPATGGKTVGIDTTPGLPTNIFGNGNVSMGLSQMFNATQAPSSPLSKRILSDLMSELPSPGQFHSPIMQRPSTAPLSSPPTKLKAPRRWGHGQRTTSADETIGLRLGRVSSDEDMRTSQTQKLRAKKRRQKIDKEAEKQLKGIKAVSKHVKGNLKNKEVEPSRPITSSAPVEPITLDGMDDSADSDPGHEGDGLITSAAEKTTRNVTSTPHVQVPMTTTRVAYGTRSSPSIESTPLVSRQKSACTDEAMPEIEVSQSQQYAKDEVELPSSGNTEMVASTQKALPDRSQSSLPHSKASLPLALALSRQDDPTASPAISSSFQFIITNSQAQLLSAEGHRFRNTARESQDIGNPDCFSATTQQSAIGQSSEESVELVQEPKTSPSKMMIVPETSPAAPIDDLASSPSVIDILRVSSLPLPIQNTISKRTNGQTPSAGDSIRNVKLGDSSTQFDTAQTHPTSALLHDRNIASTEAMDENGQMVQSDAYLPGTSGRDLKRPLQDDEFDLESFFAGTDDMAGTSVLSQPIQPLKKLKGFGGRTVGKRGAQSQPALPASKPLQKASAEMNLSPRNRSGRRSPSFLDSSPAQIRTKPLSADSFSASNPRCQRERAAAPSLRGSEDSTSGYTGSFRTRSTHTRENISYVIPSPAPRAVHPPSTPTKEFSSDLPVRMQLDTDVIAPNRVFALFRGNTQFYYPATVLFTAGIGATHIKVRFDDRTEAFLDSTHVRSLDVHVGDLVKVDLDNMRKKGYLVVGLKTTGADGSDLAASKHLNAQDNDQSRLTDVRGHNLLVLVQKRSGSFTIDDVTSKIERVEVPMSSIYLVPSMWNQFRERQYEHVADFSPTSARPTSRDTTSDINSAPVTPSRRRRLTPAVVACSRPSDNSGIQPPLFHQTSTANGLFSGMVFAVSYDARANEKELVIDLIQNNGGTLLGTGFDELFTTSTQASGEDQDHDTLLPAPGAGKVGYAALICDNYTRKAKYMQALALGLPCLSGRWIQDCVEKQQIVDWTYYLLPAGPSKYLYGSLRSRTLDPYDAKSARFSETIESKPNLLGNRSVLIITGRGKAEELRKAYVFLTLALGASRVTRVPNVEVARRVLLEAQLQRSAHDNISASPIIYDFVYADGNGEDVKRRLFGADEGKEKGKEKGKRKSRSGVISNSAGPGVLEDVAGKLVQGELRIVTDEYIIQSLIFGKLLDI
jgi:DNA repair protein Crb2 Tudor domain/BRCA1 C Terminus (BRCT) domain